MPYTLVSFHAHPDDEALLTAGTLARAAAEGHRVVIVVATAGGAGLASSAMYARGPLAHHRMVELRNSALALGCARVECLGFQDSGMVDTPSGALAPFALAERDQAAKLLAALLDEEQAHVLTIYDPAGGYGHPDHVQVHRVGTRAAEMAGTPIVLEATVDRRPLLRILRMVRWLPGIPENFRPSRFTAAFAAPEGITHRVDVRRYISHKRAAMAAHASQASADNGRRTLAILLKLPSPLFRALLGREWYVEHGRKPGRPLIDDIFATLRDR